MKRGEVFDLKIVGIDFKSNGYGIIDNEKYYVKNGLPGETLKVRYTKSKAGKNMCKFIETIEKSEIEIESICDKFKSCGGCTYLNLSYEDQIKFKEKALKDLFDENNIIYEDFKGVRKAPSIFEYRNKMEFSFGDEVKDGELELGLHKKGNPFAVVPVYECRLVDSDYRIIMKESVNYFRENNLLPYKLKNHRGYLRNLIIRKGKNQLMVALVTSSQESFNLDKYKEMLLKLNLESKINSIIHIVSDSLSDAIQVKEFNLLFGEEYIVEELFGLKFKINLLSFFQTNTEGAEVLYEMVKDHIKNESGRIFDLYCGTGTIGQILSKDSKEEVIGVEIVKEAVDMAINNAKINNLNCKFICGDVAVIIKEIKEKPEVIVIDPPRAGISKDGVRSIASFNAKKIVYVSCGPKSLVEDLKIFIEQNYIIKTVEALDMFPNTYHLETVVLLTRKN